MLAKSIEGGFYCVGVFTRDPWLDTIAARRNSPRCFVVPLKHGTVRR